MHAMNAYGGRGIVAPLTLYSAQCEVNGQFQAPVALLPGKQCKFL